MSAARRRNIGPCSRVLSFVAVSVVACGVFAAVSLAGAAPKGRTAPSARAGALPVAASSDLAPRLESYEALPVPSTGLISGSEDEVSAAIASLFGAHAREYQNLSEQAAAFHRQFVQALTEFPPL